MSEVFKLDESARQTPAKGTLVLACVRLALEHADSLQASSGESSRDPRALWRNVLTETLAALEAGKRTAPLLPKTVVEPNTKEAGIRVWRRHVYWFDTFVRQPLQERLKSKGLPILFIGRLCDGKGGPESKSADYFISFDDHSTAQSRTRHKENALERSAELAAAHAIKTARDGAGSPRPTEVNPSQQWVTHRQVPLVAPPENLVGSPLNPRDESCAGADFPEPWRSLEMLPLEPLRALGEHIPSLNEKSSFLMLDTKRKVQLTCLAWALIVIGGGALIQRVPWLLVSRAFTLQPENPSLIYRGTSGSIYRSDAIEV